MRIFLTTCLSLTSIPISIPSATLIRVLLPLCGPEPLCNATALVYALSPPCLRSSKADVSCVCLDPRAEMSGTTLQTWTT